LALFKVALGYKFAGKRARFSLAQDFEMLWMGRWCVHDKEIPGFLLFETFII
jgi:hypothetical protein